MTWLPYCMTLLFLSVLGASAKIKLTKLRSGRHSVVMPGHLKGVKLVPWHQHLSESLQAMANHEVGLSACHL